ncbi:MAG TPA: PRC-barrel domain-containing protein [Vicinamibacterales bacterium]|nr:PRC-barrel domain-containing protein [Vicinamibacterales bacterium]
MDSPRPWLRYVDASDLDNSAMKFDGMPVDSPAGEKLGEIDGLIVDVAAGRPYYVVVDGGGWFKSKYFLLPIGHVRLSAAPDRLVADLNRDRVERFPGFSRGEFEKLTDQELDAMATQITDACCPPLASTGGSTTSTSGARAWTTRAHYATPSWWNGDYYRVTGAAPVTGDRAASTVSSPTTSSRSAERDAVIAHGGDVSPHAGGRAQPGDVLGIETGGEETHVGDTTDDENERRRDAERDAAKRSSS